MIKKTITNSFKILLAVLLVLAPSTNARGDELGSPTIRLEFEASQPCGLLRFMDSLSEQGGEGPALAMYIRSQKDIKTEDLERIREYKALNLNKKGLSSRLKTTACEVEQFDQFYSKAREFCPTECFTKLSQVLNYFRPVYDQYIWQPCAAVLRSDLEWFKANETQFTQPLEEVKQLFMESPGTRQVFTVNLVPVPFIVTKNGVKLRIKSYPSDSEGLKPKTVCAAVNILPDAITEKFKDPWLSSEAVNLNKCTLDGNEVVFHELVHLVWAMRGESLKDALHESFHNAGMIFSYDLLNESQASALTAWFHKRVTGKETESDWYDNKYVSAYARVLRPILEMHMQSHSPLDDKYSIQAMNAFEKAFPNWRDDPQIVLWHCQLVAECNQDRIGERLNSHIFAFASGDHQMTGIRGKTWQEKKVAFLDQPDLTTVFLLKPNQIDVLKQHFDVQSATVSELKSLYSGKHSSAQPLVAAIKTGKRWLIFCIGEGEKEQVGALETLAKSQKITSSFK